MIRIDGSYMEGGGQLLRMATSYACILSEPVNVFNIRGKRKNPGLRPQHLATLKAATTMSKGNLSGGIIGSGEITLKPGKNKGGHFDIDIGTAGSISLMLQCLSPITWFSESSTTLNIRGGTDVRWSPPISFLQNLVYPAFNKMGVKSEVFVRRTGFYPKGYGEVHFSAFPINQLKPFTPKHQEHSTVHGLSICGGLPLHVAERQAKSAEKTLHKAGLSTDIAIKEVESNSPGSMICLWSDGYIGSDSLGERGKPAEKVGSEAATMLLSQLHTGADVDRHTGDHLILPCSLASGKSRFKASEVTLHTLTAIEVAKIFTDAKFEVEGKLGKPGTITIQGIGYRR